MASENKKISDEYYRQQIIGTWIGNLGVITTEVTYTADDVEKGRGEMITPDEKVPFTYTAKWAIKDGKITSKLIESNIPSILPVGTIETDDIISITDTEMILIGGENGSRSRLRRKPLLIDEAKHLKLVKRFMEVSKVKESHLEVTKYLKNKTLNRIFDDPSLNNIFDTDEKQDKLRKKYTELANKYSNWEYHKEVLENIYACIYSDDELEEMIRFYGTPIGQKLISKNVDIIERNQEFSENNMLFLSMEFHKFVVEMSKDQEMKKEKL
jgi:hypothetical protein